MTEDVLGKSVSLERLEFIEEKSRKFWEIEMEISEKSIMRVRWGRIGSVGQSLEKVFSSPQEAEKERDRLVTQKSGKGYKDVFKTDEFQSFIERELEYCSSCSTLPGDIHLLGCEEEECPECSEEFAFCGCFEDIHEGELPKEIEVRRIKNGFELRWDHLLVKAKRDFLMARQQSNQETA